MLMSDQDLLVKILRRIVTIFKDEDTEQDEEFNRNVLEILQMPTASLQDTAEKTVARFDYAFFT